jgi:hypothetical protein
MDVCREVFPPATPIGDGFVHCWAVGDGTSSVPDEPSPAVAGGPAA